MKIKALLFASSLAVIGGAIYFGTSLETKTADYLPRQESKDGSYLGMIPYMKMLRGNIETGNIEVQDYVEMANVVGNFDRQHQGDRSVELSWWEMGPDNIGGRTRAILASTDEIIFAGSVTGGLYKSTDAANTWQRVESLDAFGKTMAISCIDQTPDGTIFIGTGSAFESGFDGSGASGAIGVGAYYSTDGGASWTMVPGTETTAFSGGDDWAFINTMCADPNHPSRIWLGGDAGFGYWEPGMSEPNMNINGIPGTENAHSIDWAIDGSYALLGLSTGDVYRTTDGGNNWTQVVNQNKQRVSVAISKDDVNYCYVQSANGGFNGGLIASSNKGDNFTQIWPSDIDNTYSVFGDNGQAYYDLCVVAQPGNPAVALVGGVTLWKAGSATQPEQIAYNFPFGAANYYVHSDNHTFEVSPNGTLYIGGDGGIFKSVDGGVTFTPSNKGYNVTQFYGISHSSGYAVIGGSQDNGTLFIPGLGGGYGDITTITWQQAIDVSGGDGFDCELTSPTVPGAQLAFTSIYNGDIQRFSTNGSGGAFYDDDVLEAIGDDGEAGSFYTALRLYENTADENSQQYVILNNNRDEDIFSYIDANNNPVYVDTTLFTNNFTLPFNYTFPLGDTLHYWPTLVRPEIYSTEPLTEDPNYPWLEVQELTATIDSCITDSILVGFETQIDEIIEQTITVYFEDSVYVPEIDDYVIFEDSVVVVTGYDTTYIEVPVYDVTTECTTWYYYASDTLTDVSEQWLVQDKYTSMFVTGFFGAEGMWLTRQALNLNVAPDWWRLGNAPASGVKAFEFTKDGSTLFYSSLSGQLFRVDNLDELWSEDDLENIVVTQIYNAGNTITSIAIDPNDSDHLVITVGGYGTNSNGKVLESNNALSETITFSNIWNFSGEDADLEKMPVFSSIIDVQDESGNTIVVGTEFGIWASNDGGDSWQHASLIGQEEINNYPAGPSVGTLAYVPVFDLRQQQTGAKPYVDPLNYGVIYAGTHGRGIFRSDNFFSVGVSEPETASASTPQLLMYPNPTTDVAYLEFELPATTEDVQVQIFNIQGQLVSTQRFGRLNNGTQRITIDASELANGNYIVRLQAGAASGVSKFVKM